MPQYGEVPNFDFADSTRLSLFISQQVRLGQQLERPAGTEIRLHGNKKNPAIEVIYPINSLVAPYCSVMYQLQGSREYQQHLLYLRTFSSLETQAHPAESFQVQGTVYEISGESGHMAYAQEENAGLPYTLAHCLGLEPWPRYPIPRSLIGFPPASGLISATELAALGLFLVGHEV